MWPQGLPPPSKCPSNLPVERIEDKMSRKTNPFIGSKKPGFVIRVHVTDGSVESFAQNDEGEAQKLWDKIQPTRLLAPSRLVLAGEHSKSVYVTAQIVRVDFIQKLSDCWEFPGGRLSEKCPPGST
jgi:hypothetical protein